jgi:hypothetical protein
VWSCGVTHVYVRVCVCVCVCVRVQVLEIVRQDTADEYRLFDMLEQYLYQPEVRDAPVDLHTHTHTYTSCHLVTSEALKRMKGCCMVKYRGKI